MDFEPLFSSSLLCAAHKSIMEETRMGYTIEDMLVVSQQKYQMKLIAGRDGWSNSISCLINIRLY